MFSFPRLDSEENMVGYAAFYFLPTRHMVSIPRARGKVITDHLVATQDFFRGYSVYGELQFEDGPEKTPAGHRFPIKISGSAPVSKPEYLALFDEMLPEEFIVIIEDLNGRRRICGTIENGMQFNYKTEGPGYTFEFTWDTSETPPFYFGDFVVDNFVLNANYIPGVIYTVGGFWHFDNVPPVIGVGKDGDGYFDSATNNVYEKQLGAWVEIGYLGPNKTKEALSIHYSHIMINGNWSN